MLTRKIPGDEILRVPAHHGAGEKKLYLHSGELSSAHIEAMEVCFLPSGGRFPWHHHEGLEETLLVIHGFGTVLYHDETLPYKPGDCFIFRDCEQHAIENMSPEEAMFVVMRIVSI